MTKRKPSKAARAIVLGGPALALVFTLYVLVSGNGARLLFTVWFWAVIWTFLAALASALWQAFQGDRSVFTGYTLLEKDADRFEWASRTGRYAWRRDYEEGGLYDDDGPFGHGPIT